uniref:Uncharacterized protein n=1 Tax=Acrobeloides nanus TaxID=290746 RepID=A0A914CIP1_9BILA
MLSDDAFQKLLFDLFCTWHDVQRHYDPPLTHTEEEKMFKVKNMICKLLGEIDVRVKRLTANLETSEQQEFVEEWTMLTWNVLCITSRLQNSLSTNVRSPEDRMIFAKLNEALVELVNQNSWKEVKPPTAVDVPPEMFGAYTEHLVTTMRRLHDLYRALKNIQHLSQEETENFLRWLNEYAEQHLYPFIELFKTFCNEHCVRLWKDLRAAQIRRMLDLQPMQDEHVTRLACFYSHMMYTLAILSARLQGFRYELTVNKKVFGLLDPVKPLSDAVFSALELLMSDCILSAEPSTNPILVTNNLFSINCGALARGVVFKQFDIQIVTEEVAEHIQVYNF